VFKYDMQTDTWSDFAELPSPPSTLTGFVVIGEELCFFKRA
jgi:hypothetical protein